MIHSIAHDDSRCGRGGPRAAPARPPDRGAGRRRRCRASYPPQAPPPRPHSPPNSCTRPGAQAREGLSTHHSAAAHELRRPALPMRPRGGRPMAVDAKAASRRALPAGRPRRGRRNGPDYLPDHRPADAGPPQSPLEPGKNGGTNRGPPSAGALARTRQGGRRRSTAVRAGAQGPCDPAGRVKGPFWPRGATGAAVARGLEGVPLACSLATCYSPRTVHGLGEGSSRGGGSRRAACCGRAGRRGGRKAGRAAARGARGRHGHHRGGRPHVLQGGQGQDVRPPGQRSQPGGRPA